MSDIQSCEKALREARKRVSETIEEKIRKSPWIDETGLASQLISLLRMIDAVLATLKSQPRTLQH